MEFNKKIKSVRLAEGLSRKEFCLLVDIPRATLRNYEQGVSHPPSDNLLKITNHERFKKYALWLVTGEIAPDSNQVCPDFSILLSCGLIEDEAEKRA